MSQALEKATTAAAGPGGPIEWGRRRESVEANSGRRIAARRAGRHPTRSAGPTRRASAPLLIRLIHGYQAAGPAARPGAATSPPARSTRSRPSTATAPPAGPPDRPATGPLQPLGWPRRRPGALNGGPHELADHAIGGSSSRSWSSSPRILAFFFALIPNYPVAVALLTIVIMAALTPLTVKSTKNMAAMQALGPEMKKLQQKYKGAENRAQLNEEMMKLYKEHNVNPASGCLPMLLQMPFFFVLYSVIRGITNTVIKGIPAHYGDRRRSSRSRHGADQCAPIPRVHLPIHRRCTTTSWLPTAQLTPSESTSPRSCSPTTASPVGLHPLRRPGGSAPSACSTCRCPGSMPGIRRQTGQSAGGHAAEIHATHIRIHLPKCGGNSQRLFHRFECASGSLTQEILFRKGIVAGPPPAATGPDEGRPRRDRSSTGASGASQVEEASSGGSKGHSGTRAAPNGNGSTDPAGTLSGRTGDPGEVDPVAATGSGPGSPRIAWKGEPPKAGTASGSRSRQGNPKGCSSGSNGSKPQRPMTRPQPKEHPRSKAKRERKAR